MKGVESQPFSMVSRRTRGRSLKSPPPLQGGAPLDSGSFRNDKECPKVEA